MEGNVEQCRRWQKVVRIREVGRCSIFIAAGKVAPKTVGGPADRGIPKQDSR
jgi:hypothetical protein